MIEVGKEISREIKLDGGRIISLMGPDLHVHSTPGILSDIEFACRDLLPMLEEGQDSAGSQVSLDHLGAAAIGATVFAKISGLEKRRVTFEAAATARSLRRT